MVDYEINVDTLVIVGISLTESKVITKDKDYRVKCASTEMVNNTCKFFGSNLMERMRMTKRLTNISVRAPIIVEETKNIVFFPLKSIREKNNIWISYNNIKSYDKYENAVKVTFKGGKSVILDCSFYMLDNQVTRCLILDYEHQKRLKTLQK